MAARYERLMAVGLEQADEVRERRGHAGATPVASRRARVYLATLALGLSWLIGGTSAPAAETPDATRAAPVTTADVRREYAGEPLAYWQDLLARHLNQETDADKEQCRRAAQALGLFGREASPSIPHLIEALQSPSLEVREFAVDALGRIGEDPQVVVPAIIAEMDLPRDHINYAALASFRRLAAQAVGRFGPGAAAAVPLLERALDNEDLLYRVQAARALWRIARHRRSLPTLRAALKQNQPEPAFEAARALATLDADAAAPAAPDLIAALDHPDADVRRAAGSALVGLGPSYFEPVAQRLAQGELRSPAAAVYVLGQLLKQLRQTTFYAPQMDMQQLAAASRPALRVAVPALVRLLGQADLELRQTTVQALAETGLLAAPALLQALSADDPALRLAAMDALARLEDHLPETTSAGSAMAVFKARLTPRLVELMKHADPQVRRAAFRAFAGFSLGADGRAAEPLLRGALRDPDLAIRRYAFEALRQLDESSAGETR